MCHYFAATFIKNTAWFVTNFARVVVECLLQKTTQNQSSEFYSFEALDQIRHIP